MGRRGLFVLALALACQSVLPPLAGDAVAGEKKGKRAKPKPAARAAKATKAKSPEPAKNAPVPAAGLESLPGPTRIDFDDRLIQGQTNKSGAVYLFDRKETGIKSMVKRRKSFRELTLSTIYDEP